ncbi:MAG: hypothetical protein V2A72_05250 [Candidatus Omnitrophota bacterium]
MMLDSGKRVKKKKKMPNEMSLCLRNIFTAVIRITAKRLRLDRVGISNNVFDTD